MGSTSVINRDTSLFSLSLSQSLMSHGAVTVTGAGGERVEKPDAAP